MSISRVLPVKASFAIAALKRRAESSQQNTFVEDVIRNWKRRRHRTEFANRVDTPQAPHLRFARPAGKLYPSTYASTTNFRRQYIEAIALLLSTFATRFGESWTERFNKLWTILSMTLESSIWITAPWCCSQVLVAALVHACIVS